MKKLRKIAIIAGLSIVTIVLLVFVLAGMPFVLNLVKTRVEQTLQQELAVQTRIASLRGNLLYSLEASDIEIGHAAAIENLRISYDLLKILRREIDIRSIWIDGLDLNADSIQALFPEREVVPDTTQAPPSPLKLQVRDFTITNSTLHGDLDLTAVRARVYLAGRLTHDQVSIDSLFIATDSSSCTVKGTLLLDSTFTADFAYHLDIALGELNIDGLAGTIVDSGYVRGTLTEPSILNSMHITGYYRSMLVAGAIDAYWHLPALDSIRIDARITAQSVPHIFQYATDSTFDFTLHVKEKAFLCDIVSPLGRIRADGQIKGSLDNPDVEMDIAATLQHEGLTGAADVSGYYKNDSINVRSLRIKTDGALLEGSGIVDAAAQRVKARIDATIPDIGYLNRVIHNQLPISGRVSLTALVTGFLPQPRVSAEIKLDDVQAYAESVYHADLTVHYQTPRIELTNGLIRAERGDITVHGIYDHRARSYTASVQTDSLQISMPHYFNADTIPITAFAALKVQGSGTISQLQADAALFLNNIVYDTLALGDLQVHALLGGQVLDLEARTADGSLDLVAALTLDEYVEFTSRLLIHHFNLARFLPLDTGTVAARISARGSLNSPEKAYVNVTADSLFVRKEQTEIQNSNAIVLTLDGGAISLDTCNVMINGHLITARGVLPAAANEPGLSLELSSEKINLSDILLIMPDAPRINGTVQINASVRGSMQSPVMNGMVLGENLGLTMENIVVDSVHAQLRFQNNHIVVDDIRGNVNKGTVSISGFVDITETGIDTMNFTTNIRGIDIAHKNVGNATVSAEIRSTARKDSITLHGDITIDRGTYDVPFNHQTIINLLTKVNQPPPQQTDFIKRTYCDIGITSSRGIAIKNNIADIGVDTDLQIKGYLSRLNVYGTIATVRKGTLMYLGKKFDIERAVIQFDDPYKVDPVLDLEAASFVSADDGDYDIRLFITGTAEKWVLQLQSTPPIPEQDIVSLLLLGRRRPGIPAVFSGKSAKLKGAAMDYAMNLARGQIEKTGERTLGLDKLTITGDLLDPRKLGIDVEKRIAPRLTVVYGTDIESWELHRIGVNYEISDNISVNTLHDPENENSSVDLNFRFRAR